MSDTPIIPRDGLNSGEVVIVSGRELQMNYFITVQYADRRRVTLDEIPALCAVSQRIESRLCHELNMAQLSTAGQYLWCIITTASITDGLVTWRIHLDGSCRWDLTMIDDRIRPLLEDLTLTPTG